MFAYVYFRSKLSYLDEAYICTDSDEIEALSITSDQNKSGTQSCSEAVAKLGFKEEDINIDIQGYEPMVNPNQINALIEEFLAREREIMVPCLKCEEFKSSNIVRILDIEENKFLNEQKRYTTFI